MNEYYLFISSYDSKQYFPGNTHNDFTIQLPETLYLKEGTWFCSLIDFKCRTPTPTDLYVMCDLVQDSYVRGEKLPALRAVTTTKSGRKTEENIQAPIALPMSRHVIETVSIYIRGTNLKPPSFKRSPVTCTLRLFKQ